MKIHIPGVEEQELAEKRLRKDCGLTGYPFPEEGRQIRRIEYRHARKKMEAEVGESVDAFYRVGANVITTILLRGDGECLAISHIDPFGRTGVPIFVRRDIATKIEWFED